MDPKIAKKTQDTLGKIIKKPPLTEKLLSKPPFRFLHDVMTSVIKSTGVMKGLYTDSELNSENVKDRDSKIAFLQKAVDYVSTASGKQLTVKPAKVVAGHEPEKTNEFLQALAQAISSKVDNDDVLNSMNNKDKPSKKEEKEEKTRDREKSSDRRKRDEDKRSRERGEDREKDRGKDREDRHKDRSRDREERHKEKEERHKDREHRDKDRDREREREGRHKSGRTRLENMGEEEDYENDEGEERYHCTPDDIYSDVLLTDEEMDDGTLAGNATYAVLHPSQVFTDEESLSSPQSFKPIPRQVSRYQNMKKAHFTSKDELELDLADTDGQQNGSGHRIKRPKAARPRRKERTPTQGTSYELPDEEPNTPVVSEDDSLANRAMNKGDQLGNEDVTVKGVVLKKKRIKSHKKATEDNNNQTTPHSGKGEIKPGIYPKTSTPNSSPVSPKKNGQQAAYIMSRVGKNKQVSPKNTESDQDKLDANVDKEKRSPVKSSHIDRKQKEIVVNIKKPGDRKGSIAEQNMKKMADAKKQSAKEKNSKRSLKRESLELDKSDINAGTKKERRSRDVYSESRRRSREDTRMSSDDSPQNQGRQPKKSKEKIKYRNDDYAHEKIKSFKSQETRQLERYESEPRLGMKENDEAYYKKKQPHENRDRRKRSSFTSMLENKQQRREEEGKENDNPKETMVNGDHKNEAPQRIQRPSSAKGSRRRMEGGNLSSDEDVPVQRQEPTLGEDDVPPQIAGRLARPSSARPAPPKRKEDTVQNEPAMRLGSGKPQNLILDDGKDSDEDETFVVEDAPAQLEEPEQPPAPMVEEDDEDHGGLVKKIMESKKEYEQPRETKIERPTISDAQRRKQREAVQREIDKLRGSIQTLTRSANPLGKIMDYVQEDLDSMQKELEKWKEENKEHALALKREKAITERAVEPLRVQLSEVDQAIKDQLDLIGAVKSNIIRNDQKIEKMLRTIAKS